MKEADLEADVQPLPQWYRGAVEVFGEAELDHFEQTRRLVNLLAVFCNFNAQGKLVFQWQDFLRLTHEEGFPPDELLLNVFNTLLGHLALWGLDDSPKVAGLYPATDAD